jgi:hypothetical protein
LAGCSERRSRFGWRLWWTFRTVPLVDDELQVMELPLTLDIAAKTVDMAADSAAACADCRM